MIYGHKKLILQLLLPLIILFSCATIVTNSDKVVIDENYYTGTLDNGLSYYIYPTDESSETILLQVTVKAGSIYETEEERGLSHFLEHIAFTSTEKYNRQDIERIERELGIPSGTHSNAYTSYQTVNYHVKLREITSERLDILFDIMSQKTLHITFDPEEVEGEKGIIISEKQFRESNPKWKPFIFYRSVLLDGTLYPDRLPIGKEEVINNANPEILRDFYKRWYRPSRMAVSVIGDITQEEALSLIKKYFSESESSTPVPPTPAKREIQAKDLVIKGFHNSTQPNTSILISHIENLVIDDSVFALKNSLLNEAIYAYTQEMLQRYLREKQFESSLLDVSLYRSSIDSTYLATNLEIEFDVTDMSQSITEARSFLSGLYQFSQTEEGLEVVKDKMVLFLKDLYTLPQPSLAKLADKVVDNFIYQYPLMDTQLTAKKYGEKILETLTTEDIIAMMDKVFKSDENQFIVLFASNAQKDLIDEDYHVVGNINLENILSLDASDISFTFKEQEEDFTIDDILETPQAGSIVDEIYDNKKDVYTWKLSNGNTVVFKEVSTIEENNNQIIINSINVPISYQFKNSHSISRVFNRMIEYSTIKDKPYISVNNKFNPFISLADESITVETNQKEYMKESFQATHLIFSQLELIQASFKRAKYDASQTFEENKQDPLFYTIRVLENQLHKHGAGMDYLDTNNITQLEYQEIVDFAEGILASQDTVFVIVANETADNIKPLVEQWIASIPTEVSYDINFDDFLYPIDSYNGTVTRIDNNDVGYVLHVITSKDMVGQPIDIDNRYDLLGKVANDYVTLIANERLREELGNSYFVIVDNYIQFKPFNTMRFLVLLPTPNNKGDETLGELTQLLDNLVPVNEEQLEVSKNIVIGNLKERTEKLSARLEGNASNLHNYILDGNEIYTPEELDDFIARIEAITVDEMNDYLNAIFNGVPISIISIPSDAIEETF